MRCLQIKPASGPGTSGVICAKGGSTRGRTVLKTRQEGLWVPLVMGTWTLIPRAVPKERPGPQRESLVSAKFLHKLSIEGNLLPNRAHMQVWTKQVISGQHGRLGPGDFYVTLVREENYPQILWIEFPALLSRWGLRVRCH